MSSDVRLVNAVDGRVEGRGGIPLEVVGEVVLGERYSAPEVRCNLRVEVFDPGSRTLLIRYDFDPFVVPRGERFSDRFHREIRMLPGDYVVQLRLRDLDIVVRDQEGNDVSEENRSICEAGYHATVR